MIPSLTIDPLRNAIVAVFPELSASRFSLLGQGWHSTAIDVDDHLIFKFPRSPAAEIALLREARLLAVIRPHLKMPIPELTLHRGPPLFSRHRKLKGDHLLSERYERLPERARQHLAEDLARFYAELHRLDACEMRSAGAEPIEPWLQPDEILRKALPALPRELKRFAEQTISAWAVCRDDPYGAVFGFFDGHGWNMSFDYATNRLAGIYDFADAGFGPTHQDFIYSNFISRDLTGRIVTAYEMMTGRALDRDRIDLLTGVHRLSELADLADDPSHSPAMVEHVAKWARQREGMDRR